MACMKVNGLSGGCLTPCHALKYSVIHIHILFQIMLSNEKVKGDKGKENP